MIQRDELSSSRPLRHRCGLALLAGLLLLLGSAPAAAQVTGISYTLSPLGSRMYWDDDAGLSDDFLYGGELGLGFGEYLEASGVYLYGNRFETDFSNFSGENPAVLAALAALPTRDVKVQRYGGKLRVNLGHGSVVPFVSGGTGIIRFDPDNLSTSENIYVNLGAGATFSLADRYTLSVGAENLIYRFNPGSTLFSEADLAQVGITAADFTQQTVYNPALSASLKFYLGGRSGGELTEVDRALLRQIQGGGFRLAVEPFYGQINFNDKLDFPDTQALAGVNAGLDLGPYVGVRAFYWRATEEETVLEDGITTSLTDLAFYGGEMDLRFRSQFGGGITPFLVVGGGYADVGKDYVDFSGTEPESRYFAIGGGGVELPLSEAIKLQGGVRGLFMSSENIEDVSDPNSVYGSLMYTAGINFNLGGSGRTAGGVVGEEIAATRAESAARAAEMERELATIQARLDSLEAAQTMMPAPRMTFVDSVGAVLPAQPRVQIVERDTLIIDQTPRSNLSGQTITIPVPEVGEIYVRFGSAPEGGAEAAYLPPTIVTTGGMMPQPMYQPAPGDTLMAGGLSAAQIRQIVRQALAEQPASTGTLTAAELDASLRGMERRLEDRIARETNRLRAEMDEQPREVRVVREDGTPARPSVADTSTASGGLMGTFSQRQLVGVLPFVGVRLGESTDQFLIGVRGDYRFPDKGYRFLPEAALGFSDGGVALSAFGNVGLAFGNVITQVQPYAGAGVGFVTDSGLSGFDLALNLFAGAEYTLVNGMTFFGEFSTLDVFDFNRVLVGYRLRF